MFYWVQPNSIEAVSLSIHLYVLFNLSINFATGFAIASLYSSTCTISSALSAFFIVGFNSDCFCISDQIRRLCNVTRRPITEIKGSNPNLFSGITMKVIKNMTVPVSILHITPMSAFRSDAHVGMWGDNQSVPDCSHWCLPGVPDAWNEIFFTYLLTDNRPPL